MASSSLIYTIAALKAEGREYVASRLLGVTLEWLAACRAVMLLVNTRGAAAADEDAPTPTALDWLNETIERSEAAARAQFERLINVHKEVAEVGEEILRRLGPDARLYLRQRREDPGV
jgi:hypothetical protein